MKQQVVPKKKLVESAAEPYHVEIYLSRRSIDLWLSAVMDYCQCQLAERQLHFRDTLMFQSHTHKYAHMLYYITQAWPTYRYVTNVLAAPGCHSSWSHQF